MPELAVRVDKLGKYYSIGTRSRAGQAQLRDVLSRLFFSPFRRLVRRGVAGTDASSLDAAAATKPVVDHIWALRGVSFDVPRGQILGIVGPNGAGKSTLLKILSRITEPTEGRAELRGRIASLLEVGVGFHPELTGRENIYLSGALLGMRKAEITRKLDEIVAFAEVEKFVETPVKHYSSGMYVRLAFAVAAHLETEILIVDEVLAVGDSAFQRKCINKMEDVRQHGRTILFVTHNMPVVARLCQRAILISDGVVQKDGPSAEVVGSYLLSHLHTTSERSWPVLARAPGNEVVRLRSLRICDESGRSDDTIDIRRPVTVEMIYDVLNPGWVLWPYLLFYNEAGVCAFATRELDPEWRARTRPVGRFVSRVQIPGNFLAEGVLLVASGVYSNPPFRIHFYERDAVAFHINDTHEGDSARGDWQGDDPGVVRPLLPWSNEFQSAPPSDL
jgi:lipopolysaccharide transport system ATP-binding protein